MDELKLLPCPFCGGEAKIREIDAVFWDRCIECRTCYCKTGEYNNVDHTAQMIAAWNRRPPDARPSIARYRERLKESINSTWLLAMIWPTPTAEPSGTEVYNLMTALLEHEIDSGELERG